jgi:hypothetical protein
LDHLADFSKTPSSGNLVLGGSLLPVLLVLLRFWEIFAITVGVALQSVSDFGSLVLL